MTLHGKKREQVVLSKVSYVQKLFTQLSADPCIFIKKEHSLVIIAFHIDDLILLTKNNEEMDKTKSSYHYISK